MNFSSKGILAAVCLTGSLTIEHKSETEIISEDPTFVLFDHHLSFGFNNVYADDTEDGDEDPREKRRQQCIVDAKATLDDCYDNLEDIPELMRFPFKRQCLASYSMAIMSCNRI